MLVLTIQDGFLVKNNVLNNMNEARSICLIILGIFCANLDGAGSLIVKFLTAILLAVEIYFKIKNKGK
jgi:hypothetical protein